MHERCAAWDFGKDLKACVRAASPSGRRSRVQEIRIFPTTTNVLLEAGCLSRLLSAERRPDTGWTVVRPNGVARVTSGSVCVELAPRGQTQVPPTEAAWSASSGAAGSCVIASRIRAVSGASRSPRHRLRAVVISQSSTSAGAGRNDRGADRRWADSHSPWERASNETSTASSANSSQSVPISSDPTYLAMVASDINDRPRKIHDWKKHSETFTELVEGNASTDGIRRVLHKRSRPNPRAGRFAAYHGLL
jgi:hypothetical protein